MIDITWLEFFIMLGMGTFCVLAGMAVGYACGFRDGDRTGRKKGYKAGRDSHYPYDI